MSSLNERHHALFTREQELSKDILSGAHAWIQWKGTNVCADVYCACGAHFHIDDEFAYHVKCPKCGRLYAMCANIRLMPVTAEEIEGMCEPVTEYGWTDACP